MPRYFFDIDDHVHLRDEDGTVLNDLSYVEGVALRSLTDMARDNSINGQQAPLTVTVRDEAGSTIYRATMTIQAEWLAKPGD